MATALVARDKQVLDLLPEISERLLQKADGSSRAQSVAYGIRAWTNHPQGPTFARKALFHSQQAQAPDLSYLWHWALARHHQASGNPTPALAQYTAAIHAIDIVRPELSRRLYARGTTLRDEVGALYMECADLYLKQADNVVDARAQLLLARDVIERFKHHELADYFQDDCVSNLTNRRRELSTFSESTAILYVIPLQNRTVLLVERNRQITRASVEVSIDELTRVTRDFRRNLETRTHNRYLMQAKQLYQWLILPIEAALESVDTVVFVPDGALRTIPLAAVHDGTSFFATRFATAIAPGLSLLEPSTSAPSNDSILLSGVTEAVQGFPALPFVKDELQNLTTLYNTNAMLDEQFQTQIFADRLKTTTAPIVHIASHGELSPDASESYLLTFDGKLTFDRLEAMLRPRQLRGQPVELLTLSACQTASGDDRAALGLAGLALKSGARSAIASLWYVNDEASAALITSFYSHLHENPGLGKALAMQRAQVGLLKQRRFRHPGYWAPFLVIGNWL